MKYFVWMMIAIGALQACQHRAGYVVQGELPDADGMELVLTKLTANSDEPVRLDSCIIKKGKFKMKGTLEFPEYCQLYVGDNGPLLLIVENTAIRIDVNLQNIQASKVTGSRETDLLAAYNEKLAEMDTMRQERIEYMKQFVAENPNSIAAALAVNNYLFYHLDPDELETCVDGFDEAIGKSTWVQSIKERVELANRIKIGSPFVDLNLPDPDGNDIFLSDYAGKDNYLLVYFWASWCKQCRLTNTDLVELYNEYHDKGLEMVSISLDVDKTEWIKAIEDDALPGLQMSDLKFRQSEGARLYMVHRIPYIILLDKDGKILKKDFQLDELEELSK